MKSLLLTLPLLALFLISCGSSNDQVPQHLYKITTMDLWNQSQEQKSLALSEMDQAFIHLAEEEDVEKIIHKFFPEEKRVVVLTLDPSLLTGRLVKEVNPGGTKKYFHLYEGSIPFKAIVKIEKR